MRKERLPLYCLVAAVIIGVIALVMNRNKIGYYLQPVTDQYKPGLVINANGCNPTEKPLYFGDSFAYCLEWYKTLTLTDETNAIFRIENKGIAQGSSLPEYAMTLEDESVTEPPGNIAPEALPDRNILVRFENPDGNDAGTGWVFMKVSD